MKYLSEYMEDRQTALFKETNTFFAFSKSQLMEGLLKTGLEIKDICHMGMGMYCQKDKSDHLTAELDRIYTSSITQDIEENGIEAIIDRELANHEAGYTGDIESTVDALADYPTINRDTILERFKTTVLS